MAKSPILLLLFLLLSVCSTTTATTNTTAFIVKQCRNTKYATLCVYSLSTYAAKIKHSQQLLVQTALSISLEQARSTKSFVRRLKANHKAIRPLEAAALKDCVEVLGDAVDQLTDAGKELVRAARSRARHVEFQWYISNVQTWVSAALTDDSTCLDGFEGSAMKGKVKSSVQAWVDDVERYTSNALALINQYATTKRKA